jgi:hypothetical protein
MPASSSPNRPERVLAFQGTTEAKLEQHRYHRAYLHYLVGWRDDEPWPWKYALDETRMREIRDETGRLVDAASRRPDR